DYDSERPDQAQAAGGSQGGCGPARRRIAATGGAGRSARRRTLARAVAATFGGAEGRNACDPGPAGRRAAERRINGDAARASSGPAVARNERAAPAVADRHAGNTDHAFGRDHAGDLDTGART